MGTGRMQTTTTCSSTARSAAIPPGCEINVGGNPTGLADFMAACTASLRGELTVEPAGFAELRDTFVAAGLAALHAVPSGPAWIQFGLSFSLKEPKGVHALLAGLAREWVARPQVTNFFFMHKPPGIRLRFECDPADRLELAAQLREILTGWRAAGAIRDFTAGVYEPEAHLFGGPVSMHSVHRLFTADSLAWLGYHTSGNPDPAWALSLIMIRSLMRALGVAGWEDRDVWDRVRRQAFRQLPEFTPGFAGAAHALREAWSAGATALLSPSLAELTAEHAAAIRPVADSWRTDYFESGHAYVGPREAIAYYIVFHWNRAALPMTRQALIAEALAQSPVQP
jgi:thiopeptide-type bacteriocin biosynthesis protein